MERRSEIGFLGSGHGSSILAVFVHPDDETIIGPLLAYCAIHGITVRIVCLSSGETFTLPDCDVPVGEETARLREGEMRGACRIYGVPEPLFFRERSDLLGLLAGPEYARVQERLRRIVNEWRTDTWITFGPEGFTGHTDHKATCCLVTDLFQRWDSGPDESLLARRLYYVCLPQSVYDRLTPDQRFFNPVPVQDEFVTTVVDASDGLNAGCEAFGAYASQFLPEHVEGARQVMRDVQQGRIALRLALSRDTVE